MRYSEFVKLDEGLYYDSHPNSKYWTGDCPIFAIALHKLTNYPLMGLVEYDAHLGQDVLIHAYVKTPNGEVLDAVGDLDCTISDVLSEFPNDGDAREVNFNEADLLAIGYGDSPVPELDKVLLIAKDLLIDLDLI